MGKPRMIILIRHAQSEGNKNREIHQSIPDHRVKLTPEGHRQAHDAGSRLRDLLNPDDTLHFFTSPYRRTRETTEGIMNSLTSDSPSPSPFPRHTVKVYEEPRLREQDFGNFQPCSAEMERMWLERADYGHFFYRIPNGESAADAYDRVSGFNESLWRLFGEDDFASVCILVTHGLMTRVFLMKWYHWSVEYFEDLRNINHCEFVVMKLNPDNGKYRLENKMRTWSEMKKQKELERQREHAAKGVPVPSPAEHHVPVRRRWGGCPDGCDHGSNTSSPRSAKTTDTQDRDRKKSTTTHDTSQEPTKPSQADNIEPGLGDRPAESIPLEENLSNQTTYPKSPEPSPTQSASQSPPDILSADESFNKLSLSNPHHDDDHHHHNHHNHHHHPKPSPNSLNLLRRPDLAHRDTEDHLLHPPVPRSHSNFALLHLGGRDGGGSLSGANSLAPSEDEAPSKTHSHLPIPKSKPRTRGASFHQPRPSQDLANDGDDEGSGKMSQKLRRSRSHHHHHHHSHLANSRRNLVGKKVIANGTALGDVAPVEGSENERPDQQDNHEHEHEHEHVHDGDDDDDILEVERQRDQSIRGSVY